MNARKISLSGVHSVSLEIGVWNTGLSYISTNCYVFIGGSVRLHVGYMSGPVEWIFKCVAEAKPSKMAIKYAS